MCGPWYVPPASGDGPTPIHILGALIPLSGFEKTRGPGSQVERKHGRGGPGGVRGGVGCMGWIGSNTVDSSTDLLKSKRDAQKIPFSKCRSRDGWKGRKKMLQK